MGTRKNRLSVPVLPSTNNLCFEQKYEKYQNFYLKLSVFGGDFFFNIFEKACFRNVLIPKSLFRCLFQVMLI